MAIIKSEQLSSGSYSISGSFSGSFIGDGTQLSGIAASKWSGSNPITRDSNVEITGSLSVSGSLIVTTSVTASSYTGSFTGDGSQLTAITASVLTGFDPNSSTFTIELIDVLTLDFYAPFDMQINTVTDLVNIPTTTIEVEDVAYVLEDPITAGDKITVTVDLAAVVQLNAERI